MAVTKVDCIILSMLKEERNLFLEDNTHFIFNEANKYEDFLEFIFFDKNGNLRRGVFCSGGREMGNNEAGKLFYKLSRKYKSELYINIGVVGYINDVNIGDVVIVDENFSLCEKNVSNSELQKTDAKLDTNFINIVYQQLSQYYSDEFTNRSKEKMKELCTRLKKYEKSHDVDLEDAVVQNLHKLTEHKCNVFKLGTCATYHSVVKDDETKNKIEKHRKTNIVDMEAYYFNDWHSLISSYESGIVVKNSKMIFIKSVSDNSLAKEKKVLEDIGSRKLAMSNIYDIVSCYVSRLHEFSENNNARKNINNKKLLDYFNEEISSKHIDKLIASGKESSELYNILNKLCSYLVIESKLGDYDINEKYIESACEVLMKKNQTLVIQSTPGKGKSTFISYVYKNITNSKPAVFVSIPEIFNNSKISALQLIYLLGRLLESNNDIIVFLDGLEGCRNVSKAKSKKIIDSVVDKIIGLINKYGHNVSVCIETWQIKSIKSTNILSKINAAGEINTLTFKGVSAFDKQIDSFVQDFSKFYKVCNPNFEEEKYVDKVLRIIKSKNFQLRYVDFRLLYIFAREYNILKNSPEFFDFIERYCLVKSNNNLLPVYKAVECVIANKYCANEYRLLTKNIYSRAFVFSKYIYTSFLEKNEKNINHILSNEYILSDIANMFLNCLINSDANNANHFASEVLRQLQKMIVANFVLKYSYYIMFQWLRS